MAHRYVAAIDQGTTSSRCIIFDSNSRILAVDQREHRQIFPRPGWVEHDAEQIWARVQEVVTGALDRAGLQPSDLTAVGITNQRETTVLWDRATGRPVHHALVWQDTRTEALCADLAADGGRDRFAETTGLPVASYFSGPKIAWLLEHVPGVRERAEAGELLFGTIDTWLIWNLTGGAAHVTDVTNASRTLLMDLRTLDWDDGVLAALDIPRSLLPEIRSSAEVYGTARGVLEGVPIAAALGDQQAALFGQTCFGVGDAKSTYGTGSFLLLNTGDEPVRSRHGLLTTVGYQLGSDRPVYALEGSIANTGSLTQWLRDRIGLISTAAEIETLALTVEDNGGLYLVPAFSGLFAPHWRPDARGVIVGLTGFAGKGHLARCVLEATAFQTRDVVDAMVLDSGVALKSLKVDGGMTSNNLLMQTISDMLDVPVIRPFVAETTCLGAAHAAGLVTGVWSDLDALRADWQRAAEWTPRLDPRTRERRLRKYHKAVELAKGWIDEDDEIEVG
ncbi:glycerol kinase GlpK [Actinocorallia sp. API 0066]|uniref:glycerol kinase GlpK n=1 Tax=Actinocorallia sp. API 0066 TaxID=2896846 RepID=UPI001E472A11|nr:glycerol kinase GlpK [Actinocorallia sp. API 0066]MCD0453458.1 glycerol kinase GlpK [Actinocorallia sp. API 0066]